MLPRDSNHNLEQLLGSTIPSPCARPSKQGYGTSSISQSIPSSTLFQKGVEGETGNDDHYLPVYENEPDDLWNSQISKGCPVFNSGIFLQKTLNICKATPGAFIARAKRGIKHYHETSRGVVIDAPATANQSSLAWYDLLSHASQYF